MVARQRSGLYTSQDGRLEIGKGNVFGHEVIHKFGANSDVGTSSEDIWTTGGDYNWLTAVKDIQAVSDNDAADTSGGAGARKVMVMGLNDNFEEVSEEVALDGTTEVDLNTQMRRVYRAYVTEAGTYSTGSAGANTGTITIKVKTAGTVLATIEPGRGQTEMAVYTVPAGKRAYLMGIHYAIGSTQTAGLLFWQRQEADNVAAPFSSKRVVYEHIGLSGRDELVFQHPIEFPEKTDLWMSAIGGASGTDVVAEFILVLVDE